MCDDAPMAGIIDGPTTTRFAVRGAPRPLLRLERLAAFGAALLATKVYAMHSTLAGRTAVIWCAHVRFDRALGYSLTNATSFVDTHLGQIGRAARTG